MKILVLNAGSSSLKYQLINMENEEVITKGTYERIGMNNSFITVKQDGEKIRIEHPVKNHEKALKFVTIFGRAEEDVIQYKNDIIARAILDILLSGRPAPQIRDHIFSVLSTYNSQDLNLDTPVYQPGYIRPLKQCLLIDASGKIREIELLTNFIESFLVENVELALPDGSFKYTLKDLCLAFDFALIDEGSLKSEAVFDMANTLKVRLHSIIISEYSRYFKMESFLTTEQYISTLISKNNRKAQIINFNLEEIDDKLIQVAEKFGVEPRKLLSHVLEYELIW